MKKLVVAAVAAAAMFGAGMANADSNTVLLGYAQTQLSSGPFSFNMPGFNVKYNWESDQAWGIIGSVAYTSKSASNAGASIKLTYTSVAAGPSWRFSEYANVYALLGFAHGRSDYNDKYESYSANTTNFAYGAGVQINPISNIAIDASYIYSQIDTVHAGTWMIGVGYRF